MSWKQYGGIKNLDSYNNISVGNIIADRVTVRDKFLTDFQIIGDTGLFGNVILGIDSSVNLIEFKSKVKAIRDIDLSGNLTVNGKINIASSGEGFFLQGTDDNRLGINNDNPFAVIDIVGSYEAILNVYSDQSNNRNIIARNYSKNGVAVNTIDASSSSLQFYSGTDISNNKDTPDSEIKYLNGGILEIITGQDTRILSQVSISKDGSKGHIHNETMIVYDISNGTYKNLYYKDDTIIKGNAFSVIAYDASANTSINITTPDGKGAVIGGGAYPKDTDRSMLILDVSNNSEEKPQALMIVSGTTNEKYNTTTSINKYISQLDRYSLDVNGATYIADSQIKIIAEPHMELLDVKIVGDNGIALGSYSLDGSFNIFNTINGGITWTKSEFLFQNVIPIQSGDTTMVTDIFINDSVKCFTTQSLSVSTLFYSENTGNSSIWYSLSLSGGAKTVYSFIKLNINNFVVSQYTTIRVLQDVNVWTETSAGFTINDIKGHDNTIYVVGDGGNIKSYVVDASTNGTSYSSSNIFTERTAASYNNNKDKNYKKVFVYNADNIIAMGNGIITYTHNGGSNWHTEEIREDEIDVPFNDIHIKSENEAIIVGENGVIYVSHDGYRTWTLLSKDYINGGGTSDYLIGDTSNNITSVTMSDENTIITTHLISYANFDTNSNITEPYPDSRLLATYAPSLFNRYNKSTLDVIGSVNVSGDLVLHDRGELKTTDISFGLLKTNTKQIDFGLSGELINIGADTGLVDMKGYLQVANDVSFNSTLDVIGETTLHGFLDVSNSTHIKEQLTVDGSVTAVKDVSFNSTLDVSGTTTLHGFLDVSNSALIKEELTVDGSVTVAKDVSFNSTLNVIGATTLHGFLDVSNSAHIKENLTVDGCLTVAKDASFNSTLDVVGETTLHGFLDVSNSAHIKEQLTVYGSLTVVKDASFNSTLDVVG